MGKDRDLRVGPNTTRRAALDRRFMSHRNVRGATLAPAAKRIHRRYIELLNAAGIGQSNRLSSAGYLGRLAAGDTRFPRVHPELPGLAVEAVDSVLAQVNDCLLVNNRDAARPVFLGIQPPAWPDNRCSGDELDPRIGQVIGHHAHRAFFAYSQEHAGIEQHLGAPIFDPQLAAFLHLQAGAGLGRHRFAGEQH